MSPDDTPDPLAEVAEHVARSAALPPALARRVVDDVVALLTEPVEDLVRRRHRELQARGAANVTIFRVLAEELARRPVAAPVLSERQLRRLVYG